MRRRDLMIGGLALGGLTAGAARGADSDEILKTEFALEAVISLGPTTPVGETPRGKRNRIPITGGTFEGSRIKGKVLPGIDWALVRTDGFTEFYADYMIQADDGVMIHVINSGLFSMRPGKPYARTRPIFEAPAGPHAWLNEAVFTGTLGSPATATGRAVLLRVFKLL